MSSGPAQTFLTAFRDAAASGDPLDVLADDVDGFVAALDTAPGELDAAMIEAAASAGGAASVSAAAFASAACTTDGRIVAGDPGFAAWDIPARSLAEAVRQAGPGAPRLSAIVDDVSGRPVALAVALLPRARAWPLGETVRAALESGGAAYAVLGVRAIEGAAWSEVFSAWGLSPSEGRVAAALVRTGDLRRAAAEAGITYETARDTIADAMAKTGARRQPQFVQQITTLAFGDLPANDTAWQTLADVFRLSARQARLAHLVALGATRATAASALTISDQSAKADLKVIYERCNVDGGAALSRIVAELDALTRLASATDVEIRIAGAAPEPLRFIRRRRRAGRIAVEDHGPAHGIPVIVFHTPTSGRRLARVLVETLHAAGLRPISVERPGFGLTSPAAGDFLAEAHADLIDVLDALSIKRTRLLGLASILPLMFAGAHPERCERGVMITSAPPGFAAQGGAFGAVARMALTRPGVVDSFVRMFTRLSNDTTIERMTEQAVAGSSSDLAAFADPTNRRDYIRASRQAWSGEGMAREFVFHAGGGAAPVALPHQDWTILFGDQDGLKIKGDPAVAWRAVLPNARIRLVAGGGRFLHLSHPSEIADALTAAW